MHLHVYIGSPGGRQVNVAHEVGQHEAARHAGAASEEGQADVCGEREGREGGEESGVGWHIVGGVHQMGAIEGTCDAG